MSNHPYPIILDAEYIARISHGKDSLKMLDVIISRGYPLDRVTSTDVWATDTIRAELPGVVEDKERIEEWLWRTYRLEVEHLCARNADGSKRTYEQMFYHIPKRRSQSVQAERERERAVGFPVHGVPWCQSTLKRNVITPPSRAFLAQPMGANGVRNSSTNGCETPGIPCYHKQLVQKTQSFFAGAHHEAQG